MTLSSSSGQPNDNVEVEEEETEDTDMEPMGQLIVARITIFVAMYTLHFIVMTTFHALSVNAMSIQ